MMTIGRSCWFVRLFASTIHLHLIGHYFSFIFGGPRVRSRVSL
jgi:hypothetical protein